ncbi:MAG: hypothetical protein AAFY71_15175 [Bacteroidota bacterium]
MDQITFTQEYEFNALLKLSLYRYFSRPILIILYAFWAVFIFYNLFLDDSMFDSVSLFIFLGLMLLLPWAIYKNTAALFRQHYFFKDEITFTISDEEVKVEGEGFATSISWEHIHTAREYPNWILLFPSRNSAYYIYKPQVDPMDWEILKSVIKGRTEMFSSLRKS